MAKVPHPPPIGTVVKSHIALEGTGARIYQSGELWVLTEVIDYHSQGSLGYWGIRVQNTLTNESIRTYDDYFKEGHHQTNDMDIATRPCLFP